MPLWLLVDGSQPLAQVRDPPLHYALISRMQQAFFMVIEQLPDQGRVLVPGLTMGVLGQDYVGTDSQSMRFTPRMRTYLKTGSANRESCI